MRKKNKKLLTNRERKREQERKKTDCRYMRVLLSTDWPIHTNFQLWFSELFFLFGVLARGCILMIWATNKSKPIQVYDDFVYMNFASYKFVCSVSFLLAFSSHETNEFECITFSFIHYMFTWLSLSSPVLSRYVIVSRNVLIELDQLCILICIHQLDQNMC